MKKQVNNIVGWIALVWLLVGLPACSDEEEMGGYTEVCFTATLPEDLQTRAYGEAPSVHRLVVGVFDADKKELLRKEVEVTGTTIEVPLQLAQGLTYQLLFWADHGMDSPYDISDFRAIQMKLPTQPVTFEERQKGDAFFATVENFNVGVSPLQTVKLTRPVAQINVGTSATPLPVTFATSRVPNIFYPFSNTTDGAVDVSWSFTKISTESFVVEGTTYNYLALGYLFAPANGGEKIEATLNWTAVDGTMEQSRTFTDVTIEANKRTNIVGNLLMK